MKIENFVHIWGTTSNKNSKNYQILPKYHRFLHIETLFLSVNLLSKIQFAAIKFWDFEIAAIAFLILKKRLLMIFLYKIEKKISALKGKFFSFVFMIKQ